MLNKGIVQSICTPETYALIYNHQGPYSICCRASQANAKQNKYLDMQKKGYSKKFWVPRFFFIAIRCTFDIYINCSTIITFQYLKTYMQNIATI